MSHLCQLGCAANGFSAAIFEVKRGTAVAALDRMAASPMMSCVVRRLGPLLLAVVPFVVACASNPSSDQGQDASAAEAAGSAGAPITLAAGQHPGRLAVDSAYVYWTDSDGNGTPGSIRKVPITGGSPTVVATARSPFDVAVDANNIYWTDNGDIKAGAIQPSTGTVMKMPRIGGTPVVLASGQDGPAGIAIDSSRVYWTNIRSGTVMTVSLGGGTPIALASGQDLPRQIAVDSAYVYWTNSGQSSGGHDSGVEKSGTGTVMKVPAAGGTPVTLAADQYSPMNIAVDATNAYWTNADTSVMKVGLAGGVPVVLATGHVDEGLAVDATNAYWVESGAGGATLMREAKGGGPPLGLASDPESVFVDIAVDSTSVYWTSFWAGTVMKLTPK